jgi:glycine betaine/proline transport system substrate-binding protein
MPPLRKSKATPVLVALLAVSACGSQPGSGDGTAGAGKVTLTTPTWAGGQANTAVAAYILEEELGYDVTVTMLDEDDAWKAIGSGKADAILEDWGHPELEEKYVDVEETVVPAGDLGVTGKIGWYVPEYLAAEHPGITEWQNLNDYADLLATPETGEQGRLLEGSPEFVTRDDVLIENLGLDFETVYAGSEQAQLDEIRELARKQEPFLTYWWRPHWVESGIDLTEVSLPAHYPGCAEDEKTAKCGYPETDLEKYLNADFAANGGEAAQFLENFRWSEEDQNAVARVIADGGLSPRQAAKHWAKDNEGTWKPWLWNL